MLEVGAPFLSSYLLEINMVPADSHLAHPRLHIQPSPRQAAMAVAYQALEAVAVFVNWHEDLDMWLRIVTKRQGHTHVTTTEQGQAIPINSFDDSKVAAACAIK